MIGVLVPIHHTGNLMVKMMVWAVEYIFFFQKKALYYLVGTKVGQQLKLFFTASHLLAVPSLLLLLPLVTSMHSLMANAA